VRGSCDFGVFSGLRGGVLWAIVLAGWSCVFEALGVLGMVFFLLLWRGTDE
jgi:hypothetical protein